MYWKGGVSCRHCSTIYILTWKSWITNFRSNYPNWKNRRKITKMQNSMERAAQGSGRLTAWCGRQVTRRWSRRSRGVHFQKPEADLGSSQWYQSKNDSFAFFILPWLPPLWRINKFTFVRKLRLKGLSHHILRSILACRDKSSPN
jgi:hypothetical protein